MRRDVSKLEKEQFKANFNLAFAPIRDSGISLRQFAKDHNFEERWLRKISSEGQCKKKADLKRHDDLKRLHVALRLSPDALWGGFDATHEYFGKLILIDAFSKLVSLARTEELKTIQQALANMTRPIEIRIKKVAGVPIPVATTFDDLLTNRFFTELDEYQRKQMEEPIPYGYESDEEDLEESGSISTFDAIDSGLTVRKNRSKRKQSG